MGRPKDESREQELFISLFRIRDNTGKVTLATRKSHKLVTGQILQSVVNEDVNRNI